MKRFGVVLVMMGLSFTAAAAAAKGSSRVTDSRVVREWCQAKSEKYFKRRHLTPYNWSASWHDEVNLIVVEGEWLVGDHHVAVRCEAERGSTLKRARMEIGAESGR